MLGNEEGKGCKQPFMVKEDKASYNHFINLLHISILCI
jgi:hypothetical protein